MARIEFDGEGIPIPLYAIPPFGSDSNLPPTILTFTDSADLQISLYSDLGYTHFEAWCIGAAGGAGGGVQTGDITDQTYAFDMIPSISYGGEGGGGGLYKIGGLLADLPPLVPIVVGHEGVAGQDGTRHYRWRSASSMMPSYYPDSPPSVRAVTKGDRNVPYMTDADGNAIPPYFYTDPSPYLFFPNPYYIEPQDGGDGGGSSFNAPLAQASGGTGGKKSPVYRNAQDDQDLYSIVMLHAPGGNGGQGGVGDSITPGGGGEGGKATDRAFYDTPGGPFPPGVSYMDEKPRVLTSAKDGIWDGAIGQGGGGGRGGTRQTGAHDERFGTDSPYYGADRVVPASAGGKGSFSYADTSVFGPPQTVGTFELVPGTAGGARVLKNLKYGSRTNGYNPNGVVVVRLTRIV